MGRDAEINLIAGHLGMTFTEVRNGDLHTVEAMPVRKFGAGLVSAGTEPGDHIGAGVPEISTAGHLRGAAPYCERAATGGQRRGI